MNISSGDSGGVVAEVAAAAAAAGAAVLDIHSDLDHQRSVITLAARQGELAGAITEAAARALQLIDLERNSGVHPRVGAVDVAPVVFIRDDLRGAACAEALVLAARLGGELAVPVFLYGPLADGRTRAELRQGGLPGLVERIGEGLIEADFGPVTVDPRVGATLVAARPPMVAFNLVLGDSVSLADARRVAGEVREGGSRGLPGVRALGLRLERQGIVQLSANLERPSEAGIAELHAAVSEEVEVVAGELIGLAPSAVLDRIPASLPVAGLDPVLNSTEGCLRFHGLID